MPEGALEPSAARRAALLRVAQEALTNVLKHAHASRVQVRLRQAGDLLELEVEDDGQGGAAAPTDSGRGMSNMRARAQQLGGRLDVRNGDDGHLRLRCRCP